MTSISSTNPVVITPSVLSTSLIDELTQQQASQAELEQQVATGDQIIYPSDDPSGAANLLQLQSGVARANQYASNAETGTNMLSLANATVNSVLNDLDTLQSTLKGLSGNLLTSSPAVISGTLSQVQGTLQQLIGLANTAYEGVPIFAGTGNTTEAYDSTGTYVGAGNAPTMTVAPNTQVSAGVTGPSVFGSGTTGLLSQVPGSLGVLAQIAQDLQTNTTASLNDISQNQLPALQNAIDTVSAAASGLGAQQQSMEEFQSQATATVTSLQGELSSTQSVNMAQALTDLQLQQTSYQSALYAVSQITTNSLVKYM